MLRFFFSNSKKIFFCVQVCKNDLKASTFLFFFFAFNYLAAPLASANNMVLVLHMQTSPDSKSNKRRSFREKSLRHWEHSLHQSRGGELEVGVGGGAVSTGGKSQNFFSQKSITLLDDRFVNDLWEH